MSGAPWACEGKVESQVWMRDPYLKLEAAFFLKPQPPQCWHQGALGTRQHKAKIWPKIWPPSCQNLPCFEAFAVQMFVHIDSVHIRCTAKTSGFTRGVCRDFIKFKGFLVEFLEAGDPEKIRKPRKSPEKRTFLSLAFYNAPSSHTVVHIFALYVQDDEKGGLSLSGVAVTTETATTTETAETVKTVTDVSWHCIL